VAKEGEKARSSVGKITELKRKKIRFEKKGKEEKPGPFVEKKDAKPEKKKDRLPLQEKKKGEKKGRPAPAGAKGPAGVRPEKKKNLTVRNPPKEKRRKRKLRAGRRESQQEKGRLGGKK